jgi:hypothetical protein
VELCTCSFLFRKLLKEMCDFVQALRKCQLVSIVQQLKAKLESPGHVSPMHESNKRDDAMFGIYLFLS